MGPLSWKCCGASHRAGPGRFYQGWMRRRPDGSWVNEYDQANECNPSGIVTEDKKRAFCYQNNTVFSNGFIRRVASALGPMAEVLGEPVDPQWAEISLRLDPLPTVRTAGTPSCRFNPPRPVVVLAGNYTTASRQATAASIPAAAAKGCGDVRCGTLQCNNSCGPQVSGDGMMDVMAWPVFPGEAVALGSPESELQSIRDTLRLSAEWSQSNSFCSIFSQAARSGCVQQHVAVRRASAPPVSQSVRRCLFCASRDSPTQCPQLKCPYL